MRPFLVFIRNVISGVLRDLYRIYASISAEGLPRAPMWAFAVLASLRDYVLAGIAWFAAGVFILMLCERIVQLLSEAK